MFRRWFFLILLLPGLALSASLSTIGSAGGGGSLYACSTARTVNPNPASGKSHVHTTQCFKVQDQTIQPDPKSALALSPGATLDNVIASFFWYRDPAEINDNAKMSVLCASHRDHFGDCDWTNDQPDIDQVFEQSEQIIKDLMSLELEDLTTDEHLGCAVALCLANPEGWKSVGECHQPVKKLFRVLAATRKFPQCKLM